MTLPQASGSLAVALLICVTGACEPQGAYHPDLAVYSPPKPGVLPHFSGRQMNPAWPAPSDLPGDFRRMGTAVFRSDRGVEVSGLQIAAGRYSLVTFFYSTCNGICPLITYNMRKLSGMIGDQTDLQFLSITVDPAVDDVAALKKYRRRNGVDQVNWHFLTGQKTDIESLAREQFAGEIEVRSGRDGMLAFVHTENVFLLDQKGYLRGVYRARGQGEFPRLLRELSLLRSADHSAN